MKPARWPHPGFGAGNRNARLTEADVSAMRQARARGALLRELARDYHVSVKTAHRAVTGESYRLPGEE